MLNVDNEVAKKVEPDVKRRSSCIKIPYFQYFMYVTVKTEVPVLERLGDVYEVIKEMR